MSENGVAELGLFDNQDRWLGQVRVEGFERDWVMGILTPSPAYAQVERFFLEFEELVNDQCFAHADEAYTNNIETLGLQLRSTNGLPPIDIWDVQIMQVCKFCCKMSDRSIAWLRKQLGSVEQVS